MEYLNILFIVSVYFIGFLVGIAFSNSNWSSCASSGERFLWRGRIYKIILEEDCEDEP